MSSTGEYWEYEQYRTPSTGSTRSIEHRNTWSTAIIRRTEPRHTASTRCILAEYKPDILPLLAVAAEHPYYHVPGIYYANVVGVVMMSF